MPRSMTAFASIEGTTDLGTLSLEVRSVNHRFFELVSRLPEELRSTEPQLRERLGRHISRGKVDLSGRLRSDEAQAQPTLNAAAVAGLQPIVAQLAAAFPQLAPGSLTDLLTLPQLYVRPEVDRDRLAQQFLALVDRLGKDFAQARAREGARLAELIGERVDALEAHRQRAIEWLPELRQGLRDRLTQRLADLPTPVDPGRLEQELVLQLTRMDVDEELDRLGIHLTEARRVIALEEPIGRRLDFLVQELLREVNTFGSKSINAATTALAVDMKVLIEQIREQVQNLE
ncbi:MAG: YicC family protein [Xanthomonadales bacterium]|nr:YicC family protein [Xanthomonadales bacterium]